MSLRQAEVVSHSQLAARVDEGDLTATPNIWSPWGRATRLDFPHFKGKDFDNWIIQAEYFFEVDGTPKEEKLRIAALHQGWERSKNEVMISWEEYAARFCAIQDYESSWNAWKKETIHFSLLRKYSLLPGQANCSQIGLSCQRNTRSSSDSS